MMTTRTFPCSKGLFACQEAWHSSLGWLQQMWMAYRLSRPYPLLRANESVGSYGERLVAEYLQRKGYFLLERSFRTSTGEIDLIAVWQKRVVVFVEVKTWQSELDASGGPSDRVDQIKQKKITNTALRYMKQHRLLQTAGRFDVIEVILVSSEGLGPKFRHFEYAFDAIGRFQMYG